MDGWQPEVLVLKKDGVEQVELAANKDMLDELG